MKISKSKRELIEGVLMILILVSQLIIYFRLSALYSYSNVILYEVLTYVALKSIFRDKTMVIYGIFWSLTSLFITQSILFFIIVLAIFLILFFLVKNKRHFICGILSTLFYFLIFGKSVLSWILLVLCALSYWICFFMRSKIFDRETASSTATDSSSTESDSSAESSTPTPSSDPTVFTSREKRIKRLLPKKLPQGMDSDSRKILDIFQPIFGIPFIGLPKFYQKIYLTKDFESAYTTWSVYFNRIVVPYKTAGFQIPDLNKNKSQLSQLVNLSPFAVIPCKDDADENLEFWVSNDDRFDIVDSIKDIVIQAQKAEGSKLVYTHSDSVSQTNLLNKVKKKFFNHF